MDNKPHFSEETNMQIQHLTEVILAERFNDLDADQAACMELLTISEKEGYLYGTAFAYAYLGDCLIGKNESISASLNLLKAKDLCEKNRFLDLLPYVCTWLGIYYEMQNDRQMAMHYYLDALEFSEKNHDLMRQSILLNNIASQFQSCGNYDVAREYYIKAFQCFAKLEHPDIGDPHYAQMTANIISVCCRLEKVDEARYYYTLLEKSELLSGNKNQLYLCKLLISACLGDVEALHESIDDYFDAIQIGARDLHQLFETLLVVSESLISLNEPEYAHQMLTTLGELCKEDEYGHRLKVQYVWMRYYKDYGTTEEKDAAYRRFYELRKISDSILNRNLSEGLLSKIKLRESVKKNEEIESARKLLENELQLDELTQLYNRRSFRKLTEQAATDPSIHSIGFIMIDVDYFKQYNDTYGHKKGDDTLRAVAQSMLSIQDDNIYNFRYGGDEFVSMCKNMTAQEMAYYIETFSKILYEKNISHKTSLCSDRVTLSIGYSVHTRWGVQEVDTVHVLSEADTALYWSKDQGRNCYNQYDKEMKAI